MLISAVIKYKNEKEEAKIIHMFNICIFIFVYSIYLYTLLHLVLCIINWEKYIYLSFHASEWTGIA